MQEAPPRPPAGPSAACPNCGAPVDPDQLSCLECGTPLRVSHRPPPSWRGTVLAVALALLVLGTGIGFLLRELTTDAPPRAANPAPPGASAPSTTAPLPTEGEGPSTTDPKAEPAPDEPLPSTGGSESEAPPAEPTPPASGSSDPEPPATGGDSSTTPAGGSVASWPAGKSAFTVVLVSSERRADARREARRAARAGLPAGLLHSNDYSSLKPGYWVAYAGEFESRAEAARRAQSYAAQGFPDAYPRRVEPAP